MKMQGRRALVTGGTQGVGAAIAVRLAEAGCDIVLHGLADDANAQSTAERCKATGVQVETRLGDLATLDADGIQHWAQQISEGDRPIDTLVNNAGTFHEAPFLELDPADFERTMRLNVYAPFFLAQHFARRWVRDAVRGRMLFTGSINGQLAEADHTAYDSSKGAVHSMVRSLCVALAPHGIRVNAMAPGLVVTPLTADALRDNPASLAWMKLHTPNGQVPGPEVCAGAALFLLSDEAEHIHGQTLFVDGGMSAWQQPDLPDKLRGKPFP